MQHSLGLQKGLIGLVNGYAGEEHAGRNNLVAAHELLHTLGATDKYDMDTLEPIWPDGYADPTQFPLYPQTRAEIMSGRLQVSPGWLMLKENQRQPLRIDGQSEGSWIVVDYG
ncbi:hypothetical protein V6O07_09410, partial [Arthrospira platensis SPKY2]